MTYALALSKLDDLARDHNYAGTGHRAGVSPNSIRVLIGSRLIAFGRWISGPTVVAPAAESR
jgi:hypothetical protein